MAKKKYVDKAKGDESDFYVPDRTGIAAGPPGRKRQQRAIDTVQSFLNPSKWKAGGDRAAVMDTFSDRIRGPGGGFQSVGQNVFQQLRGKHGERFFEKKGGSDWWDSYTRGLPKTLSVRTGRYWEKSEKRIARPRKTESAQHDLADLDVFLKDTNLDLFTETFAAGAFNNPYTIYHTFGLEGEARLAKGGTGAANIDEIRRAGRGEEMHDVFRDEYDFFDIDEEGRRVLLDYELELRTAYADSFFDRDV